jgi:hypothetical protein
MTIYTPPNGRHETYQDKEQSMTEKLPEPAESPNEDASPSIKLREDGSAMLHEDGTPMHREGKLDV